MVSCFIDGLGGSLHAFLHSGICGSSISPVDRILLRTEFSAIFITFFLNIPWFCFLQTVFHLVPVVATLKVTSVSKGYKWYIFDLEILPGLHESKDDALCFAKISHSTQHMPWHIVGDLFSVLLCDFLDQDVESHGWPNGWIGTGFAKTDKTLAWICFTLK